MNHVLVNRETISNFRKFNICYTMPRPMGSMKKQSINIVTLTSHFSEYISQVESGERFLILRRDRPFAALINTRDLQCLERFAEMRRRLAQTLGQSPQLVEELKMGKVHPAMAAFGLWKEEVDLNDLADKILINRQHTSSRRHTSK